MVETNSGIRFSKHYNSIDFDSCYNHLLAETNSEIHFSKHYYCNSTFDKIHFIRINCFCLNTDYY